MQAGMQMANVSSSGRTLKIRPRKYLEKRNQMPRDMEAGEYCASPQPPCRITACPVGDSQADAQVFTAYTHLSA